jgi:hypothetical protein
MLLTAVGSTLVSSRMDSASVQPLGAISPVSVNMARITMTVLQAQFITQLSIEITLLLLWPYFYSHHVLRPTYLWEYLWQTQPKTDDRNIPSSVSVGSHQGRWWNNDDEATGVCGVKTANSL